MPDQKQNKSFRLEDAFQWVMSFAAHFDEPHTRLAMHAALPLGLTPELVHLIRINFASDVPWIAEADLLLSPFCKEIGDGLYEMDQHVRDTFLNELKMDNDFGYQRIEQVAKFLYDYVKQALEREKNVGIRDFLIIQKWTGLIYAYPEEAVQQLSLELRNGLEKKDYAKIIQLASLTRSLMTPLIFENDLILYIAAVEKLIAGDTEGAFSLFEFIGPRNHSINIAGIELPAPSSLVSDEDQPDDRLLRIILIVGENHLLETLGEFLQNNNYLVYTASSTESAKKIIKSEELHYTIITLKFDSSSEFDGIQLFSFARRNQPRMKYIILSDHSVERIKDEFKKYLKYDSEPEQILKNIDKSYIYKGDNERYNIAVLEKLKDLAQLKDKKKCLVIMPYIDTYSCNKKEWIRIFEELIKPAVEDSVFNYQCVNIIPGKINVPVIDHINRSELLIADLTDRNPLVFYELGIRHALRNRTILISQNSGDIPSDLRAYATPSYGWKSKEDKNKFKALVQASIAEIENDPERLRSPIRKYLNP